MVKPTDDKQANAADSRIDGTFTGGIVASIQKHWILWHWRILFIASLMTVTAYIIATIRFNHIDDIHLTLGTSIFAIVIQHVILAFARPKNAHGHSVKKSGLRFIWELWHQWSGSFLIVAAWYNVYTGIIKINVNTSLYIPLFYVYAGLVAVTFLGLEVHYFYGIGFDKYFNYAEDQSQNSNSFDLVAQKDEKNMLQ